MSAHERGGAPDGERLRAGLLLFDELDRLMERRAQVGSILSIHEPSKIRVPGVHEYIHTAALGGPTVGLHDVLEM